jgi:hypothetical protein
MSRPIPSFPRNSDAEANYCDYVEAYLEEHPDENEQDAADYWYACKEAYWEQVAEKRHCYAR